MDGEPKSAGMKASATWWRVEIEEGFLSSQTSFGMTCVFFCVGILRGEAEGFVVVYGYHEEALGGDGGAGFGAVFQDVEVVDVGWS